MKKTLFTWMAVLLSVLYSFPATAQDYIKNNYCLETVGLELEYSNLDENGKLVGYFNQKMSVCNGTLQKGNFSYELHLFKPDHSPMMKDNHIQMNAVISGTSPTESIMKGMNKVMKAQDLMTKGDVSTIPPVLKVGMQLPDSEIKLKIDSFGCSLFTTERKVQEEIKLTTPAGTFDCFVITEIQKMKIVGTQIEKLKTWYAKGIGVVRQEFYDKKDRPVRSMELISLNFK